MLWDSSGLGCVDVAIADWQHRSMDFEALIQEHLPVVFVFALIAYVIAEMGNRIALMIFPPTEPMKGDTPRAQIPSVRMAWTLYGNTWRFYFVRTLPIHPMLVGAFLGLVAPLPVPSFLGSTWWMRVLCYTAVGAASLPIFRAITARLDKLDDVDGDAS